MSTASETATSAASETGSATEATDPSAGESGSSGESDDGAEDTGTVEDGLPCEIDEILQTMCVSCHGPTPSSNAFNSILGRADLLADALTLPGSNVAEAALARFGGSGPPMPPMPGTPLTPEQVADWDAWVAAGFPVGDCTTHPEPDPFDVDPVCTSDVYWTGGLFNEDDEMNPGRECINCHQNPELFGGDEGGPVFPFAGTVFPTGHEPDDCYGADGNASDVSVVITAAGGEELVMHINAAGNFWAEDGDLPDDFAQPWTAKVVADGQERLMVAPLEHGDCNVCHTQDGAEDAPGRIIIP